jgi:ABC-type branched-subunit amino acid transport system substrate-binding protein
MIKFGMGKYFLILLLLFWVEAGRCAGSQEQVVIGVSVPLSGEVSPGGNDTRDALAFANEYYFGGKYRFIVEDDQCDKKQGLTIAQKLIALDKVRYVLGIFCNAVLLTAAPVYERAGVVVIATGATSGDVRLGGSRIFRPYPADNIGGEVLYDYISLHHSKVGILTQLDEYTELMARTMLRKNGQAHNKLKLFSEELSAGVQDYRPALLRLKAKGIDGLFLNPMGEPAYITMVRQLHELKFSIPHYASCMPASPASRTALGVLDEGTRFANLPLFEFALSSEGQEVYKKYTAKYGEPRSNSIFVALAIDSLRMLDAAILSGRPPEEYLRSSKFPGLVGEIAFDQDGAVKTLGYEMQEIRGGKVQKLASK